MRAWQLRASCTGICLLCLSRTMRGWIIADNDAHCAKSFLSCMSLQKRKYKIVDLIVVILIWLSALGLLYILYAKIEMVVQYFKK